jgi:hypothetical protein
MFFYERKGRMNGNFFSHLKKTTLLFVSVCCLGMVNNAVQANTVVPQNQSTNKKAKDTAWLHQLDSALGAGSSGKAKAWISSGLSEEKLKTTFQKSVDWKSLFAQLEGAKSVYHQRVMVADWVHIPGVDTGTYTPNGLKSGLSHAPWNNAALDLPAIEAANFVEAEALELKAGSKIYRVTGGNPAGAYWTLAKPDSLCEVIGGTAVQPAWNNFSKMYVYEVPPDSTLKVWQGRAAAQPIAQGVSNPHLGGGLPQLFIPSIQRNAVFKSAIKEIPLPWLNR